MIACLSPKGAYDHMHAKLIQSSCQREAPMIVYLGKRLSEIIHLRVETYTIAQHEEMSFHDRVLEERPLMVAYLER